jgi:hypothetical protein
MAESHQIRAEAAASEPATDVGADSMARRHRSIR